MPFYLVAALSILALLLVASHVLPFYVVPTVVIGAPIIVAVIGALQLRNDDRLSEKSFIALMRLSFRYIPLLRSREKTAAKKLPQKTVPQEKPQKTVPQEKLPQKTAARKKRAAAKGPTEDSSTPVEPTETGPTED